MAKQNNPNPQPDNPPAQPTGKMVECPECESDVNLDESNDCPNCGLEVAWVYEKRRRDKAVERLRQREEEETGKKKDKPKLTFGF